MRDFVGTVAAGRLRGLHRPRAQRLAARASARRRTASCRRCATRSCAALKRDFPALAFVAQRRHRRPTQIAAQLGARRRRDDRPRGLPPPVAMADWDERFFGDAPRALDARRGRGAMVDYMERAGRDAASRGRTSSRHMLGLRNGEPGARRWRQVWSDHGLKGESAAHRVAPGARGPGRRPVAGHDAELRRLSAAGTVPSQTTREPPWPTATPPSTTTLRDYLVAHSARETPGAGRPARSDPRASARRHADRPRAGAVPGLAGAG